MFAKRIRLFEWLFNRAQGSHALCEYLIQMMNACAYMQIDTGNMRMKVLFSLSAETHLSFRWNILFMWIQMFRYFFKINRVYARYKYKTRGSHNRFHSKLKLYLSMTVV